MMSGFTRFPAAASWTVRALAVAVAAVGLLVVTNRPADAEVHGSVAIGVPLWGWYHPHYYYPRPRVYYVPAPVYYAPPPVVYAPPPAVYAPPPVVYSPPPAYGTQGYAPQGYGGMPAPNATPTSDYYQGPGGQTCRQYGTTVYMSGQPQTTYGTACLQPDGTWRMVNG
jgi:hypothetical protein